MWSTAIVTEAPLLDSSTLSQRLLKPMEQLGFGSSLHNLVMMASVLRFLHSSKKKFPKLRSKGKKNYPSAQRKKSSGNSTVIGLQEIHPYPKVIEVNKYSYRVKVKSGR